MGKVKATALERMTIGYLVRAVSSKAKVDDTGIISTNAMQLINQFIKAHTAPINTIGGYKATAVRVVFVSKS